MNPKFLWPLGCISTLVIGWIAGFLMGGTPKGGAGTATAPHRQSSPPKIAPVAAPGSRTSGAEEEKQRMQPILAALRAGNSMQNTRDLYDAILKMPPDELASAARLTQMLPKSERPSLGLLVSRWAAIDPPASAGFVLALDRVQRRNLVGAVSGGWVDADPQAAKEWVLTLPPGDDRNAAIYALTRAITSKDPEAAVQFILWLRPDGQGPYQEVFFEWAMKDPENAAGKALALPLGKNRNLALRAVAQVWAQTNPQAALAWAAQIPEPFARQAALGDAYTSWAANNAMAALASVVALPAGEARNRMFASAANAISFSDPETAAALAALVLQFPAGYARNSAISTIVREWTRNDVTGVREWVAQLPDGNSKREAQQQFAFQWMETDPRAAADYLVKAQAISEESSKDALTSLIGDWARTDSHQAIEWTRQFPDHEVRGDVLSQVIARVANDDPQRAARLLPELPATRQSEVISHVVDPWLSNDLDGAATWVLLLPEGDARKDATGQIVREMARHDLATAAGWLEQLPLGPSRDSEITDFTDIAMATDPASAVAWAASISDAQVRNEKIHQVAFAWLRQDKDTAARWIRQSNLIDKKLKEVLLPKN